jgi:hypothetical protein
LLNSFNTNTSRSGSKETLHSIEWRITFPNLLRLQVSQLHLSHCISFVAATVYRVVPRSTGSEAGTGAD